MVLIPTILNLPNELVTQKNTCLVLDPMLDILPNDIKAVIMGMIGSVAHSSKEHFVPYFQGTVAKVQQFLTLGDSVEEVELKGITIDSLRMFAQAVGKDTF